MTITYQLDEQRHAIFVQMLDTITDADLIDCVEKTWQLPNRATFAEFIDMRGITQFTATSNGLRQAAATADRLNMLHAPLTTAIVATTDLTYGMARMYEMYQEHPYMIVRTFREYESALMWLLRSGAIRSNAFLQQ